MATQKNSKNSDASGGWLDRLVRLILCAVSSIALCCCQPEPQTYTIIKVSPGVGFTAHYYVHRDVHTLLALGERRFVVPGDLGGPGEKIAASSLPPETLSY
jgi:hypothetical protein